MVGYILCNLNHAISYKLSFFIDGETEALGLNVSIYESRPFPLPLLFPGDYFFTVSTRNPGGRGLDNKSACQLDRS